MKTNWIKWAAALAVSLGGAVWAQAAEGKGKWTTGFTEGKATFQGMNQLAFGPEGILFIADSKAATITAVATGDVASGEGRALKVDGVNLKIAAALGTTADQILIEDMVVNPISRNAYLAVSRGRGTGAAPVLVKISPMGELDVVSMEKVNYSRAELPDAPADAERGEGRRRSNPRMESITDIAFLKDRVVVAGLSNEEFSSTLRSIPFPFEKVPKGTSVEIYHGAHGQFETRAPIRTFVPYRLGNEDQLLAAYTCTPLVQVPVSDLQPGARVKGKTVAELGNRNRPLDMIVYQRDGKDFLLLANSSRGVMKVSTDSLAMAEKIVDPVKDGTTKGLRYETVGGWTGVEQLDRYDARNAVVLRKADGGNQVLESLPLP